MEVRATVALGLPFADRVHTAAYTTWPRLPEIIPVSYPGLKTSRDPLVIDIDRSRLVERMKKYFDPSVSELEIDAISPGTMEDGYMYPSKEIRASLQKRGFREWEILSYTYRPFDVRWIYWEPETALLRRKVEDFTAQMIGATKWIEARQRESGDRFSRGTVVNGLADNFGNGYSSFFPAVVIDDRRRISGLLPTDLNLSRAAESYLKILNMNAQLSTTEGREFLRNKPTRLQIAAWGHEPFLHAIATMHTTQYRTENSGALLGDWPRIPLPATAELLTHSANLGQRLAELLDPESDIQLVAEWSFLARLILPAELPEGAPDRDQRNANRLALTAGWGGAGQGATVMPRRGDARERDWTPTELERLSTLAATQSLTLDDALTLLGPRCVDIYLNGDSLWSAVPLNVWDYTLGGYQVLKKWLSYRELPLLGRPLREDEARYFAQVARRIAAILLMDPALDASYAAIFPTATGLPSAIPNM
ncbi:MAG TPA: type ISP restriction/modification enzyme [Acidobacteriaceae bacterium]|nr:type ISP restriction/modification enzyme [Acidobacteriaceae bacterium]